MKKFLCIVLCAVIVLGLIPATAVAEAPAHADAAPKNELEIGWNGEEEQVWHCVNGTPDPGVPDLPAGVSFDAESNTLTLENAEINFVSAWDWGVNKLTIKVVGENKIYANGGRQGISLYACHDVVISGTGTLDIRAMGRSEDPNGTSGLGDYGTPFDVRDCYVVDRGEEYQGEEDYIYPNGSLVIDGVTVSLINPESELALFEDSYWASAHNACAMSVVMANMELTNGAKLTGEAMDGMYIRGSLTVGEGTELTVGALDMSGVYDELDGRAFTTSLTVNGKLTVTGDCLDGVEDKDAAREVYHSSLRINPGATLVLNDGGVIKVAAPSKYNGYGIELSGPFYGSEGDPTVENPDSKALGNAKAEIKGGTLNVKAGLGICVGPRAVWEQTGGMVTVDLDGDVEVSNFVPVAIEVGGDSYEDNGAAFTHSGGTVNVNIDLDGAEYVPGVRLDGVATYAMSGQAQLNVKYTGAGNGWFPGIHLFNNCDEQGNLLPAGAAMTVSDNAAVNVDFTGFSGMGEGIGVAGISAEEGSQLTVNGGAVNITLPDGDIGEGDATGININGGTVTTGGRITVTAPETMEVGRVVGVNLGSSELEGSASVFTVNGGKMTIDIEAATLYESIGISAGGTDTKVNFNGGEVAVTLGGTEKSVEENEAWNNVVAVDAWGGTAVAVESGAQLDLSILRTGLNSGCVGILLTDRCSYTQAAGSTVTVHGVEDNDAHGSFEGVHAENYSTVSINGTLTLEAELNAGLWLFRSTLEVGNGAQITYDARNRAYGDGIMADDYSDITISGGQIDFDAPIVPTDIDGQGTYWVTGGIYIFGNTTANITGGTININQKAPRTDSAVGNFGTVGIQVSNAFLRVTGGTINLAGAIPLTAINSSSATDPVTFGSGICALYAEGTTNGEENLSGFEVKKRAYSVGIEDYCYYDYVLDPENEALDREFGVVITTQSAKAEYSALLELVNSGTVIAGQAYTARLTASLPEGSDTVTLSVQNGTVQEDSVSVNGQPPVENVTYENGTATLTVRSGDIVRFNVIPGAGENTITAAFENANKTELASFTAKDYTLELPTSTDRAKVAVSGVAAAGNTVEIYVDGVKAAETEANNAGGWSTSITLTEAKEYKVYAVINGNQTGDRTIVYNPELPVVESLTVSNWIHGRTTADPNVETSFTINFVDPSKSTPDKYYTYWPELPEFTFTVKFSQGADRVADVRVVATDWKGTEETVYLSLNTETKEWTGTHDFCGNGHITPEQFRVEWRNLDDESQGQTPTDFMEPGIPDDLWGEPEIEGDVYTPPETVGSRTNRFKSVTAPANEPYYFSVTSGATATLVSGPEGGVLSGTSPNYSVTGKDGDMYVVTVKNGFFVGYGANVTTLCISFEGEDTHEAYELAETAAQDDTFDVSIGATYTADTDKELEYLIVRSRVYKIEKKPNTDHDYIVTEDVSGNKDLNITKVYKSIHISGFGGADLEHATLEEWDGGHEELLGSIGSVPATYSINYATGEVAIDADTEAIAQEFMSSQFARDIVNSAINVWSEDLEKEFEVQPVHCKAELSASFDILGDTAAELTVEPTFTITVEAKTQGHFGEITETLTVEVGFESTTTIDYKLTMKRDENGNVETSNGFIPLYSGYISAAEDMTFSLGFTVSVEGADEGETSFLERYYAELKLEKYLDEIALRDNDDKNLPIAKLYIPIPAVPGLGFYFGDSVSFDYKLLGELSVNGEVNTGLEAGVIIADNKIIAQTGDLKPVTQQTTLTFHADASAGISIRGDIGLSLFRAMEVGVYGKAGPRVDIRGHGSVTFATDQQPQCDAEIGAQFGIAVEIGGVFSVPILDIEPTGDSFWDDYITRPEWSAGRKFMPTRFTVLEDEPTIVPAEINLCNVIDMNVSYQELVGSCEVKSKILDADKYEFQLYESDGKPVTLTKNGDLTVTDKTKAFDFWVKLLYKVHPNDEYQIWKIVPMRYTPAVIEVIKTTEDGGSRIASFSVTDNATGEVQTKSTSEAGLAVFGAEPGHTYTITENSCPAGYYPAIASQTVVAEAEGTQVKFLNRKIPENPPEQGFQSTPNKSKASRGDPSGFVYEGIESNRLEGVTTTLYKADNPSGANKSVWAQAEAEAYDQMNPLTTDALGQYLWMVPSGYWQVEYKLDGYTTQYSEWMEVPPARTGVNVNMTSKDAATATLEYSEILGCYVLRFSRPVQVATVRNGIGLTGLPDGVEGEIYGLNPLDADWSVVTGDVTNSTLCATTFVIGTFSAWDTNSGRPYELTAGTSVQIEVENVQTYMGTTSSPTAAVEVHEQAAGRYRVTVINGTGSGFYTEGEEVRVSYDRRAGYVFTGWDIECDEPIEIGSDNTFTMPACDVVLSPKYARSGGGSGGGGGAVSYSVTLPESVENGRITANSQSAVPGSTVTLTVEPEEGYVLGALTVTDSSGKAVALTDHGDGTYSFQMPYGGVTVKAVFKCGGGKICPSREFTDLDAKAWYHEYTDYVITEGLMHGVGNGLFDPSGTVTRAQMVTVLWNMRGDPVVDFAMDYDDVSESAWYAEAIRWATSEGVAGGYGGGTFGPNDTINREQMATMLYRFEKKYGAGGFDGDWKYELPFTDAAKVSDWAQEAVSWCSMKGILTGKDNNLFDPSGSAKRCEMAAVLMRYREKDTEGEK